MTKAGAWILSFACLAACGVGDEDDLGGDPNPNGLRCSAAFTVTGTFSPGTPARPLDPETSLPIDGCWPVGTWTFTAAVDTTQEVVDITGDGVGDRCGEVSGTSAPTLEASYSFRVDRTEDPASDGLVESYTYLGNAPTFHKVKVSSGGAGDCEGIMEFVSADKKQWWTFNPALGETSNALTGTGDFTSYEDPQPL